MRVSSDGVSCLETLIWGLGFRVSEYVSRMDNQRENQLEMDWATCGLQGLAGNLGSVTLLETNMETQKGLYKDYSPSKRGLYGFPCLFGRV